MSSLKKKLLDGAAKSHQRYSQSLKRTSVKELKKEMDYARVCSDQDRAHRERFEMCKNKVKDLADAVDTLHGMASDLEESAAHLKADFVGSRSALNHQNA